MPLNLNIDGLCLGTGKDWMGEYLYLMDISSPRNQKFVGGVRYVRQGRFLECKNMVSDGYGPTLLVLVAQEAWRLGLDGASPDSNKNSGEAVAMVRRLAAETLKGLAVVPTNHLQHADNSINVVFRVDGEVVSEQKARRKFEMFLGKGWRGKLYRWRFPMKDQQAQWLEPNDIVRFLKADYLRKSDEAFMNKT